MKINFGSLKGRKILVGKNEKMRPTQSFAKSIIFNVIKFDNNESVLDLFAGTGSLGFESLSLGAKKVYWVDNNYESIQAINKNIDYLKLDKNNFKTFKTDFRIALKNVKIKLNIIFLDPPFVAEKYYDEALMLISKLKLLKDNGIIVLEKRNKFTINNLSLFEVYLTKKVGEKDILFLKEKNG